MRVKMQNFANKHPILLPYLYFSYFSIVNQTLIFSTGMSGSTSLRDAVLMSVIWLIPYLLFPRQSKPIAAFLGFTLWLTSLASLGYFLIYGQDFSQSAIFIIFESNMVEGNEFISSYLRWWHVLVFLAYSAIPVIIWTKLPATPIEPLTRYTYAVCFVVIISWPFFTKLLKVQNFDAARYHLLTRLEPTAPWNIIVGYLKYREQLTSMQQLLKTNRSIPPVKNLTINETLMPETLVLVIGESTNRQRMGLYGYPRATSPRLNTIKKELTIFSDVISPRPYTIESLQQILSSADEKNPVPFLSQPTLLNILSQADFEITWITNQQTQTRRNTMLTTLSQMADKQVYLNNNRRQNSKQFDEVVLEPFMDAIKGSTPRKMIIVHLLGTHRKYDFRYPKKYDHFTDRTGVPEWIKDENLAEYNSYDNAVLYNDYIIAELIEGLRQEDKKSLFVYLSDHGEEVFDYAQKPFCGRNESDPSPAMYTVPLVTWKSKKLKNNLVAEWDNYTDRVFIASDFFYTLPDMIGINFDGMDRSRSLVSEEFKQRIRWIGDPGNLKKMKDYDSVDTFSN